MFGDANFGDVASELGRLLVLVLPRAFIKSVGLASTLLVGSDDDSVAEVDPMIWPAAGGLYNLRDGASWQPVSNKSAQTSMPPSLIADFGVPLRWVSC